MHPDLPTHTHTGTSPLTRTPGPPHSHAHRDLPTHSHTGTSPLTHWDLSTHTHTRTSPLTCTQTSPLTHRDLPTDTPGPHHSHTPRRPNSHTGTSPLTHTGTSPLTLSDLLTHTPSLHRPISRVSQQQASARHSPSLALSPVPSGFHAQMPIILSASWQVSGVLRQGCQRHLT